ncbi:MAG: ornithine cyclodeaminase family protein [Verrucomicrobia bacterium]|nr:ornithine cyclodeaminase family protein [Verrucomicrobiota bacterium]
MKATPPVLLLTRADVAAALSLDDCIAAVESAFAAHARGESLAPGLLHGDGIDGEFHIKAGGLRVPRPVFATKINGGFFQNPARHDLPAIQGLIVLQDATNGVPLAVMESGLITRLRTGAATAVAAKHLARPDAGVLTLCGAGVQAETQLRAIARVRPLRAVHVWSRHPAKAEAFAAAMAAALRLPVIAASNLGAATRASDLIVTCTPARHWFLGREHVAPGTFIAAVGADSPGKQEIEPALVAASTVVCDLVDQCAEVGDLHHALAAGLATRAEVRAELGEIVAGLKPGRRSADEIVLFDSTGTALQDAAAALVAYERAVARGLGTRCAFWG